LIWIKLIAWVIRNNPIMSLRFSRRSMRPVARVMACLVLFAQLITSVHASTPAQAVEPCHEQNSADADPALLCQVHCVSQAQVTDAAKIPVPRAPDSAVLTVPLNRFSFVGFGVSPRLRLAPSPAPPPLNLLYSRLLI
jgi:hypothetical protein